MWRFLCFNGVQSGKKSVAEKYQYGMWNLAKKSKRRFFFAHNSDDFKICSKYQGDNLHSFRVLSGETISGLILGLCPANDRCCYKVTPLAGSKPRISPEYAHPQIGASVFEISLGMSPFRAVSGQLDLGFTIHCNSLEDLGPVSI